VLAALVPATRADPRREVDESNAGLGRVLVLATLPPGAEGFDTALGEEILVPVRDAEDIIGIVRHDHCIY